MTKRRHDEGYGGKVYAGCLYLCLGLYTFVILFGREIEYAQRMILAVVLGGIIGVERRVSERPAGIRTMALVCLGSCCFSMMGQQGFRSSTMGWDAARVAAAIPSGVGFLGAAMIWKGSNTASVTNADGEVVKMTSQEVHGLTTAASVWLSAAVGVAVGGGRRLYIVSVYGVALVIVVLRFGPQMYFAKDSESMMDFDDEVDSDLDWESVSSEFSHTTGDHDDDDMEHSAFVKLREGSLPSGNIDEQQNRRGSSSLSGHASAPDLINLTYEVPIVDHSGEERKSSKSTRRPARRGKSTTNIIFHG